MDTAIVPLGIRHRRPRPSPRIKPRWRPRATVLTYLFPKESADALRALADEAATSQLLAARAFRSDVDAGQPSARRRRARRGRGKADGSDASWDGSGRLTGDGLLAADSARLFPAAGRTLAGTWRPWILASGDQYRPAPPPPFVPRLAGRAGGRAGGRGRRTPEQEAAVRFWAGGPGTVTPAGLWIEIARDLIVRDGLDALHAARVLALTSVAMADGFICCWDAKYTYWTARPITADPALDVLIPTPPFPSYTSGHATASTAAATVLDTSSRTTPPTSWSRPRKPSSPGCGPASTFRSTPTWGPLGGGMIGRWWWPGRGVKKALTDSTTWLTAICERATVGGAWDARLWMERTATVPESATVLSRCLSSNRSIASAVSRSAPGRTWA